MNDKSQSIYKRLVSRGIYADNMKICGVNTCACVHATMIGLYKLKSLKCHFKMIKDACNCSCWFKHSYLLNPPIRGMIPMICEKMRERGKERKRKRKRGKRRIKRKKSIYSSYLLLSVIPNYFIRCQIW